MALPAVMLGLQISGWIFFVKSVREGHPDFRANYSAGYMARTGHIQKIYDYEAQKELQDRLISRETVAMPFIHPAYEALLYVPVSVLPFRAAYVAFLVTNVALLLISFRLLGSAMQNLRMLWPPLPAAVLFTFLPVGAALMQGQDSIIFLTLSVIAFTLLKRGNDLWAGVALGAAVFRFQLVAPVALLFLLWKRWRFVVGIATSSVVAGALSLWMVGVEGTRLYLRSLASMSVGGVSQLERLRYAQPLGKMGNLRALVAEITYHFDLAPHLTQVIVIVLSLAVLLGVAWAARTVKSSSDLLLLALISAVVASYHLFIHDMSVLALPIVVALNRFIWAEGTQDKTSSWALRCAGLMFAAPALIEVASLPFSSITLPTMSFALVSALAISRESEGAAVPNANRVISIGNHC